LNRPGGIVRSQLCFDNSCSRQVIVQTSALFAEDEQYVHKTREGSHNRDLRNKAENEISKQKEFPEARDVPLQVNDFCLHCDLANRLTSIREKVSVKNQEDHPTDDKKRGLLSNGQTLAA